MATPECKSDPSVRAAVATLATVAHALSSVMTFLAIRWWGKAIDRYGRIRALNLATFGIALHLIIYIFVAKTHDHLPGGYRFFLVASTVGGLFGGFVSRWMALQSYITDCTDDASRPRWFALCEGISAAASAIGPTLGPLAINYSGSILSVFYISAGGIVLCTIFMALFAPESLTEEARRANAEKIDAEEKQKRANSTKATTMLEYGSKLVQSASAFLAPLAIFIPQQKASDIGRMGTEWNLALVAIAYGIFVSVQSGAATYKLQYAIWAFGWDSSQLGLWLSATWIGSALTLCALVPLVSKWLSREKTTIHVTVDASVSESSPLLNNTDTENLPSLPTRHPAYDNLLLTRASVAIEIVCYFFIVLSSGSKSWIFATLLSTCSKGFTPFIQSVALSLLPEGAQRAGELFAGLGVVHSLCTGFLRAFILDATYVYTVRSFPKAIFAVSLALLSGALTLLCGLRLPMTQYVSV